MSTPAVQDVSVADELADLFGVEVDSKAFRDKAERLAALLAHKKDASARLDVVELLAAIAAKDTDAGVEQLRQSAIRVPA